MNDTHAAPPSLHALPVRKKILFCCMVLLAILAILEAGTRLIWSIRRGAPFFSPRQMRYVLYPELLEVERKRIDRNDGYFDLLILGGSVLHHRFGNVEQILLEELTYATKRNIRIFNLAQPAHTSRDSYLKYRYLKEKQFDLVIVYHAINDVRANNCPPAVFRPDYSHYLWYRTVNRIQDNRYGCLVFPYTFEYIANRIRERWGGCGWVPMNSPQREWLEYGGDIKTVGPFRHNLTEIVSLAHEKRERVMLMSFAFHVPATYSEPAFRSKSLDYTLHTHPIELWGKPAHVVAGISAHNAIIKQLSSSFRDVIFVDQHALIPRQGRYFNDICHLTSEGCELFARNMVEAISDMVRSAPAPMAPVGH